MIGADEAANGVGDDEGRRNRWGLLWRRTAAVTIEAAEEGDVLKSAHGALLAPPPIPRRKRSGRKRPGLGPSGWPPPGREAEKVAHTGFPSRDVQPSHEPVIHLDELFRARDVADE